MKAPLPAIALILSAASLCAQVRDGRVFVEKGGVALVKPQPWSPASSAQPVRFSAYSDRRARGHGNQGYFEFRTLPGNGTRQYQAAQVVELIPEPEIPSDITTRALRDRLAAESARLSGVAEAIPVAEQEIGDLVQPLNKAVAEFDSGNVRVNGQWIPKASHLRQEAFRFSKSLRAEMAQAKRKSDFDLESNPHFISLAKLASDDPGTTKTIESLRSEYRALVAAEGVNDALELLRNPETKPAEASVLLGRLRASASPGETAKLVLRQADSAAKLESSAASLRVSLDSALGARPPLLPPDLAARIQDLSAQANTYRAGNPPAAIPAPLALVGALSDFAAKWPLASDLMAAKDFSAASRELASLEPVCSLVGPGACAGIAELKKTAAVEVDKFQKLRKEGEEALGVKKTAQAVAKFEEALAVMPDKALQEKVDGLKTK